MLKKEMIDFIKTNYLKKGWVLEFDTLTESKDGYEIDIYQVSARSRRRVCRITGGAGDVGRRFSAEDYATAPGLPEQALKLFHSPRVRKTDHDVLRQAGNESLLLEWIRQGWVLRMVLYEPDGKTVRQSEYVMGHELYSYLEQKRMHSEEKLEASAVRWKRRLQAVLSQQPDHAASCCSCNESSNLPNYRHYLWTFIQEVYSGFEQAANLQDIARATKRLGQSWQAKKLLLYADFIVALAEIAAIRDRFDWKEIGARYYREIGGSKRFDSYKDSFLESLEEGMGCPPQLIGLLSQGTITPVYFAGELSGAGGFQYPQGFLHATTDLTVFQTRFATRCRTLWLVENRAILTRMVAEASFLKDSSSLVIGLDGQLRSSHRKLISNVLMHSKQLDQVLVWCDTDSAGLVIARHVYALLQATCATVKWILPDYGKPHDDNSGNVIYTWQDYEAKVLERLGQEDAGEQEAEMGGMVRWNQWLEA